MQELLDQYRAGVLIQGIAIRQADPPDQVDEAFKAVTAARQQRESSINEARAYEQQVLERARGDTAAFDQIYEQYRLAPAVTRPRLYYETMERSEARRLGNEWVRTSRSRWAPDHYKKNKHKKQIIN